jgi:hypothetical protein
VINHVTYHLSREALGYSCLEEIMVDLLGFREIEPDDPFEHGYQVRWFQLIEALGDPGLPVIHFVAHGDRDPYRLGLGHFCVVVAPDRFEACRKSDYCARDSGSGRIWLEYDNCRLRIEVRSR